MNDHDNPLKQDESGLEDIGGRLHGLWHGNRITPRDPAPGDDVDVRVVVGTGLSVKGMAIRYTVDGSTPDAASTAVPMHPAASRWEPIVGDYVEEWSGTIPAQENGTLVRYRVQALTNAGEQVWADTDDGTGEAGLFAYAVDIAQVPRWLREAVMYHVHVERFAPDPGGSREVADERQSGTLSGLLSRFDHIIDLGANVIWITREVPFSHDAATERVLKAVIDAAHDKGIRVLLDFEAGDDEDGQLDVARNCIESGIDGYCIDSTNHAFLSRLRRSLHEVRSDTVLVGAPQRDAGEMATYDGRLDALLDGLLGERIQAFLARDVTDSDDFWRFLSRHLAWMPAGLALPSLLDNGEQSGGFQAVTSDSRRLKIAAMVQFALPHPPVIDAGTEVGAGRMPVSTSTERLRMLWGADQDRDLRSFFRALIHWRKSQGIFATSPSRVHSGADGLLVFRTGVWFIVVNRSEDAMAIDFERHGEVWLALATEFDVQLHGSALQLPAMSGAILRASDTYH